MEERDPHNLTARDYDARLMRLLLPPSETKSDGGVDEPLDLERLGFPELTDIRRTILSALRTLAADPDRSRAVLGLSARQAGEVERNAALLSGPTRSAVTRYTGVLYDAIGVASLSTAARRRASQTVVVCSALFGALRPDDPIPAYRLSAGAVLPDLLPLTAMWRPHLSDALATDGPVIDLRSGAYVTLAPVPGAVTVRVIGVDGRAVSHHNKAAKGAFVRAFLTARRRPTTVAGLLRCAADAGLRVARSSPDLIEITI